MKGRGWQPRSLFLVWVCALTFAQAACPDSYKGFDCVEEPCYKGDLAFPCTCGDWCISPPESNAELLVIGVYFSCLIACSMIILGVCFFKPYNTSASTVLCAVCGLCPALAYMLATDPPKEEPRSEVQTNHNVTVTANVQGSKACLALTWCGDDDASKADAFDLFSLLGILSFIVVLITSFVLDWKTGLVFVAAVVPSFFICYLIYPFWSAPGVSFWNPYATKVVRKNTVLRSVLIGFTGMFSVLGMRTCFEVILGLMGYWKLYPLGPEYWPTAMIVSFVDSFFKFAMFEEFLRYTIVRWTFSNPGIRNYRATIILAMTGSLGMGMFYIVGYSVDQESVETAIAISFLKTVASVPANAILGAITGVRLARYKYLAVEFKTPFVLVDLPPQRQCSAFFNMLKSEAWSFLRVSWVSWIIHGSYLFFLSMALYISSGLDTLNISSFVLISLSVAVEFMGLGYAGYYKLLTDAQIKYYYSKRVMEERKDLESKRAASSGKPRMNVMCISCNHKWSIMQPTEDISISCPSCETVLDVPGPRTERSALHCGTCKHTWLIPEVPAEGEMYDCPRCTASLTVPKTPATEAARLAKEAPTHRDFLSPRPDVLGRNLKTPTLVSGHLRTPKQVFGKLPGDESESSKHMSEMAILQNTRSSSNPGAALPVEGED